MLFIYENVYFVKPFFQTRSLKDDVKEKTKKLGSLEDKVS